MSKNVGFGAGEGNNTNQCSTNIHGIFSEFYFYLYTHKAFASLISTSVT